MYNNDDFIRSIFTYKIEYIFYSLSWYCHKKIDVLTLNTIINQCTYNLGILCIVLVGFHHVYSKKEFH